MTGSASAEAHPLGSRTTRRLESAERAGIRAHLNLYALLQNLEELVRLDAQAAEMVRGWDLTLQFAVRRGPAVSLEFAGGECRCRWGHQPSPDISLYFASARHLNAMFEGRAIPIPLRGFTRLGWLQNEFSRLTDRLEACLKPADPASCDASDDLRAALLLQTAAFASCELAMLEPTCRKIAGRIRDGVVTIESSPGAPTVHVIVSGSQFQAVKSCDESPTSKLTFRDASMAVALLEGRLDPFEGLASGDLALSGQIGMLDDFLLILDRVEAYLT